MYRRSTLNKPDGEFLTLANSILQQCTQHAEDWHIDASRVSELNVLTTKANTAYEINSNRSTRSISTTADKNAAFDKLKRFLSNFINYLEATLTVPDEAIAIMSLRPRKRHSREPIPAPTQAPAISVAIRHGQLKVYVARPAYEHATHSIKPPTGDGTLVDTNYGSGLLAKNLLIC